MERESAASARLDAVQNPIEFGQRFEKPGQGGAVGEFLALARSEISEVPSAPQRLLPEVGSVFEILDLWFATGSL